MNLIIFTCSKEPSGSSPISQNTLLAPLGLGHVRSLLGSPDLDMTGRAHIPGDPSVGSVGPSSSVLGPVDLHVLDDQLLQVQLLDIGVGFQIPQEVDHRLAGLLGPSSLDESELLGLAGSAHGSVEPSIRDASFMSDDVLQIRDGLGNGHALACSGGFVGVLEVDSRVE